MGSRFTNRRSRYRRRPNRRRNVVLVTALALGLIAVLATTAAALKIRAGDILITAEGGFSPTALPKYQNAPITLHGGGSISTVSGALPPILKTLTIEFDKYGSVQTTGLAQCTAGKLNATTTVEARHLCPGAIVGEGEGKAIVQFPESSPIPVSSPLTLFNGPPKNGDPTVLAHAYITVPVPSTYVVSIVIEKIHQGIYGYRTKGTIPAIAGGAGVPISGFLKIGRKWSYKGHNYSYINARCQIGHVQARGEFTFSNGTDLSGTFVKPCTVRG